MTRTIGTNYVSSQAICEVLGCFVNNPNLMKDYKVTKTDFPESFHKLVFAAINNLFMSGVTSIDAVVIDEFLSHYETQYKIFTRNNGIEFIELISSMAVETNIKYYYEQLKKFSLLRSYMENGIDVSEFFDPNEIEPSVIESKRALLDQSSITDIVAHFKEKQLTITAPFILSEERNGKRAGVGGLEQKEKWKKGTNWGVGYASAYLTTAIYGLRSGRYTVKSAPSGLGKTRTTISDIAYACSPKYYDKKRGCWCENPNGHNGALYIGTEMELLEEIDPIFWAYIADVPQEHIMFGTYEDGEEERVDEAIRILAEESNIWFEYIPEYSASILEELIEAHKIRHKIKHVFFDYIHTTVELLGEFAVQSKTHMNVREDQVLADLSKKLKNMARKYHVSIDTCTQVSGDYKNEKNRDQTVVAGAKSILNKADTGIIAMEPTLLELKKIEPIIHGTFDLPTPNVVYSLYKNRGGKWNKIKIWLYIDYDTMRVHDLFVTDYDCNLIQDMPKTYINVSPDGIGQAGATPTFRPLVNE